MIVFHVAATAVHVAVAVAVHDHDNADDDHVGVIVGVDVDGDGVVRSASTEPSREQLSRRLLSSGWDGADVDDVAVPGEAVDVSKTMIHCKCA